jgi:hypothetical protein
MRWLKKKLVEEAMTIKFTSRSGSSESPLR